MGRPVNVNRLVRWKPPEARLYKNLNQDIPEVEEYTSEEYKIFFSDKSLQKV